jgi:hypothetical protein
MLETVVAGFTPAQRARKGRDYPKTCSKRSSPALRRRSAATRTSSHQQVASILTKHRTCAQLKARNRPEQTVLD